MMAARMLVEKSFDAREFRALRIGHPEDGVSEMALISSGTTTGDWPSCLNRLKRSALEDTAAETAGPLALTDGTVRDAAEEDERRRQGDRTEGKLVQLGGATDEHLHYFGSKNLEHRL